MRADAATRRDRWDEMFSTPRLPARYPSEAVIRWLFRSFPRSRAAGTRLLDIGSGTGRHALFLAAEGFHAAAVDFSPVGIERLSSEAQERGLTVDARVGEADDLPFETASFDGVLSFGVLYYLPEDRVGRAINELHRVLKPGGRAFVMLKTPNDSRKSHARRTGPNSWRVESEPVSGAWSGDLGMELTLFDRTRLEKEFDIFSRTTIDRSTVTSEGGLITADEWYINVVR